MSWNVAVHPCIPNGRKTQRGCWGAPPARGKCLMRQWPFAPHAVRTPKCVIGKGDGSFHSRTMAPESRSRTTTLPHRHSNKNFLNSLGFISPGVGAVTYEPTDNRYFNDDNASHCGEYDVYATLSGFCLLCLITDCVFSQPPSIIS